MASMKKKTTELARPQTGTALATEADNEAMNALLTQDANRGYEEATKDAFAIPFLRILQDLSPQVKSKMTGYVPGAEPGMIFHTITKELLESVRVIPCYYSQTFIEFVLREKKNASTGSGFVAAHPADTPLALRTVRDSQGRSILPNGNQLVDTRQHFVLLVRDDGSCDQALISMSSSQIKASKNWMTRSRTPLLHPNGSIRVAQPPLWARSYVFGVAEQANDKGSWYGWDLREAQDNFVLEHYHLARAFNAQMRSGAGPKVNYEEMTDADTAANERPRDLDNDNDIDA
jgi:hypothetical protein